MHPGGRARVEERQTTERRRCLHLLQLSEKGTSSFEMDLRSTRILGDQGQRRPIAHTARASVGAAEGGKPPFDAHLSVLLPSESVLACALSLALPRLIVRECLRVSRADDDLSRRDPRQLSRPRGRRGGEGVLVVFLSPTPTFSHRSFPSPSFSPPFAMSAPIFRATPARRQALRTRGYASATATAEKTAAAAKSTAESAKSTVETKAKELAAAGESAAARAQKAAGPAADKVVARFNGQSWQRRRGEGEFWAERRALPKRAGVRRLRPSRDERRQRRARPSTYSSARLLPSHHQVGHLQR